MRKQFLLTILSLVAICSAGRAQDFVSDIFNEYELPKISSKLAPKLADHLSEICRTLKAPNIETKKILNNQIAQITIPAAALFAPNDTLLLPSATTLLTPLINLLNQSDFYNLIITVHSDNTGSDEYLLDLTQSRALALLNLFTQHGINEEEIELFPMGNDENIAQNNNRANRAKNRRVELYLIPKQTLLKALKK